ncbi:MAG: hypothetical protein KDD92_02175 [Caldilineaceae bacterium]|nr:hypothetical protein [Caldilineaceae bacterium]
MRFWLHAFLSAAQFSCYFLWGRARTEEQISLMQEAAFNTPGAAAPVPPEVVAAGGGALFGHFTLARLMGLSAGQSWLSLFLGVATGAGVYSIVLRNE